jgi:hypothetical protein
MIHFVLNGTDFDESSKSKTEKECFFEYKCTKGTMVRKC